MTLESEPLLDLEGTEEASELDVAPPPERMGVRHLAVDVLRHPSAAFRRLADHPDRRWLVPVILFMALSMLGLEMSGFFSLDMYLKSSAGEFVSILAGTMAGAWMYKESDIYS